MFPGLRADPWRVPAGRSNGTRRTGVRCSDADIAAVRNAGFTDAQFVEIVALVAENFKTVDARVKLKRLYPQLG